MKFLLDESAEYRIALHLLGDGHDVTAVTHDYAASLSDREVLAIAYREQRILVTNDSDFGELVFRERFPHAGVIFFRLPHDTTAARKIVYLDNLLATHADQLDQFMVITERSIRVRRSQPQ